MPSPLSHEYELRLLGGFGLLHEGDALDVPVSVRRLLAFLAVNHRSMTRTFVAGTLWPDTTDVKAAANLRTTLWRLHDLPEPAVVASSATLRLSDVMDVDVHHLVAIADLLRLGGEIDPPTVDAATLVGELLPDLSDGWLVFERERLRQISLHVLEELSRRLSSSHHHELAILAGLAAVQADPLRETANRVLVEAHLGEGNVAEAVRHFDRFRDLLRRELGVEPNPAFAGLVETQPLPWATSVTSG
ncbi:MAG: BTAD domain-containing putative transcriptional regulator [Acidimicrobiales bacterium]